MLNYGTGPASDEVEVTLFGPGYGEAIVIHLGENSWMLVDSCFPAKAVAPTSLEYLDAIGVQPTCVKVVVASHWHDDHVRGISKIAEACSNAEFFISDVFSDKDMRAFLCAYSGVAGPLQTSGTKELYNVIKSRQSAGKTVILTSQRINVLDEMAHGNKVRVHALSPTPAATAQTKAHFAKYMPTPAAPINFAPEVKPNLSAIVLHVDFGNDAVLLGSDLEEHATNGWTALLGNPWVKNRTKASVFKVAHHGSNTGDHPNIWSDLLTALPCVALTPFSPSHLPTDTDKVRIKANASQAYTTSNASKKPAMDAYVAKRLSTMCEKLSRVDPGFGAVRMRKKFGATSWEIELLGNAQPL